MRFCLYYLSFLLLFAGALLPASAYAFYYYDNSSLPNSGAQYGIHDEGGYWNSFAKSGFQFTATTSMEVGSIWLKLSTAFANENFPQEDDFYLLVEENATTTYGTENFVELSFTVTLPATTTDWFQFTLAENVIFEAGHTYMIWLKPLDATADYWYYSIYTATSPDYSFLTFSYSWLSSTFVVSNKKPYLKLDSERGTTYELYQSISLPDFTQVDGSPCEVTSASSITIACYNATFQDSWSFYGTTTDATGLDRDISATVRSFNTAYDVNDKVFVYYNSDAGTFAYSDNAVEYASSTSGVSTVVVACSYDPEVASSSILASPSYDRNNAACVRVLVGNGKSRDDVVDDYNALPSGVDITGIGTNITDDTCGDFYSRDYLPCKAVSLVHTLLTTWPFGYLTEPVLGYYTFRSTHSTTSTSTHFTVDLNPKLANASFAENTNAVWDLNAAAYNARDLSAGLIDIVEQWSWILFYLFLAYRMWAGAWYSSVDLGTRDAIGRRGASLRLSAMSDNQRSYVK